jgi:hypothetical protein
LEFVEKLVILDVMLEPYLYENFIQYDSWPYVVENYLQHETALLNVFTFWKHYQQQYVEQLSKAGVSQEEYLEWQVKEGQVLHKTVF